MRRCAVYLCDASWYQITRPLGAFAFRPRGGRVELGALPPRFRAPAEPVRLPLLAPVVQPCAPSPLFCFAGARARGIEPLEEVDVVITPTPLNVLCGGLAPSELRRKRVLVQRCGRSLVFHYEHPPMNRMDRGYTVERICTGRPAKVRRVEQCFYKNHFIAEVDRWRLLVTSEMDACHADGTAVEIKSSVHAAPRTAQLFQAFLAGAPRLALAPIQEGKDVRVVPPVRVFDVRQELQGDGRAAVLAKRGQQLVARLGALARHKGLWTAGSKSAVFRVSVQGSGGSETLCLHKTSRKDFACAFHGTG